MQAQRRSLPSADAASLAAEAYIFLYPLMFMEAFRQSWSERPNVFARLTPLLVRSLDGPAHGHSQAHSIGAWIDISAGPVLLSFPDPHERHVIATAYDAWGEVVASLGSLQGNTRGGRYLFTSMDWSSEGELPDDMHVVRSPTRRIWFKVSIVSRSDTDQDALRAIASKFRATPLGDAPRMLLMTPRLGSGPSPLTRVTSMNDQRFFSTAAALLEHNPIRRPDQANAGALRKLGIVPGRSFSLSKLPLEIAQQIQEGIAVGRATIMAEHDRMRRDFPERWGLPPVADDPAKKYLIRAASIRDRPHMPPAHDHVSLAASRDSLDEPLHGTRRYCLRFEPGSLPPANVMWSLSAIDLTGRMTPRKTGRSIGSHRMQENARDGSLDIHIETTRSRRPGSSINWLQCPQGRFMLVLELFSPRHEVLTGRWLPPLIEREPDRRRHSDGPRPSPFPWQSSGRSKSFDYRIRSTT